MNVSLDIPLKLHYCTTHGMSPPLTAHRESLRGASPAAAPAHGELRQVAELVLPHLLGGAARPPPARAAPRAARAPGVGSAHRGAALRRIRAAAPARKIPGTNERTNQCEICYCTIISGSRTTYRAEKKSLQILLSSTQTRPG